MNNWKNLEIIILIATITIGALISILDLIGVFDSIDWIHNKIPNITLLLVALIATTLLINQQSIKNYLASILPVGSIKKLGSTQQTLDYIIKQINIAKSDVRDISLQKRPQDKATFYSDEDYEKYRTAVDQVSKRIPYYDIWMLRSNTNIPDIRNGLATVGKYYHVAAYVTLTEDYPDIRNFIIIDDEVIFLEGMSITVPEIVKYYRSYYSHLWQNAKNIKVGSKMNEEFLEELKNLIKNKQLNS